MSGPARCALALALVACCARADAAPAPVVVGDAIPAPLTGRPGDAARGRAIVLDRHVGLCLLCHSGPFPQERFQGDLAPSLAGVGARLTPGQIRLRVADARRLDPGTIMPSYLRDQEFTRPARGFEGRPVLDAAAIEDVVAFLATLTEPAP